MRFKMLTKPETLSKDEQLLISYLDERDFPTNEGDEKWICMEGSDWKAIANSNKDGEI